MLSIKFANDGCLESHLLAFLFPQNFFSSKSPAADKSLVALASGASLHVLIYLRETSSWVMLPILDHVLKRLQNFGYVFWQVSSQQRQMDLSTIPGCIRSTLNERFAVGRKKKLQRRKPQWLQPILLNRWSTGIYAKCIHLYNGNVRNKRKSFML